MSFLDGTEDVRFVDKESGDVIEVTVMRLRNHGQAAKIGPCPRLHHPFADRVAHGANAQTVGSGYGSFEHALLLDESRARHFPHGIEGSPCSKYGIERILATRKDNGDARARRLLAISVND